MSTKFLALFSVVAVVVILLASTDALSTASKYMVAVLILPLGLAVSAVLYAHRMYSSKFKSSFSSSLDDLLLHIQFTRLQRHAAFLAAALENQEQQNLHLHLNLEAAHQEIAEKKFEFARFKAELQNKLIQSYLEVDGLKSDRARLSNRVQDLCGKLSEEYATAFQVKQLFDSSHATAAEYIRKVAKGRRSAEEALATTKKELQDEKKRNQVLGRRLIDAERALNSARPPTPPRSATPPYEAPRPPFNLKTSVAPPTLSRIDVSFAFEEGHA